MLVDSHCHLDAAEFDADREAVLRRARAAGVMRQIVPAVEAAGWPKLRAVCASAPGLYPAYGLHPVALPAHRPQHLAELREWIERERPCAVGECGLDYFVEALDRNAQQRWFEAQLALARDHDLPVIVHARRAVDAVIATVRRIAGTAADGVVRGVVHSFGGSAEQARQLWRLGILVGLGGPVTYPRANRLRALAATMPLEFLLLETDAPDQPDAGIRGQRNEPARLPQVLTAIAELRGMPADELAAVTTRNAERLFRLPPAGTLPAPAAAG
ncbi:TatD family hydrolase [Vulcaniibacterium gelatinicum]|uniref:TatD family hydrolase n=1 Tax=Vulcaniibacterium gelatinicum TaxID=2598725 RepID=UPI0011CC0AF3|nr:TatD family hydrolase [Vulcaniibacterium gelatinicum]